MKIELKDSIVIVDEAHNIAKQSEEIMEIVLNDFVLQSVIDEIAIVRLYAEHPPYKA